MKIEFDLPNFEKELNINIIIRKDGEVVYSASSSFPDDYKENRSAENKAAEIIVEEKSKPKTKKAASKPITTEKAATKTAPGNGGNFMNMDF